MQIVDFIAVWLKYFEVTIVNIVSKSVQIQINPAANGAKS